MSSVQPHTPTHALEIKSSLGYHGGEFDFEWKTRINHNPYGDPLALWSVIRKK